MRSDAHQFIFFLFFVLLYYIKFYKIQVKICFKLIIFRHKKLNIFLNRK